MNNSNISWSSSITMAAHGSLQSFTSLKIALHDRPLFDAQKGAGYIFPYSHKKGPDTLKVLRLPPSKRAPFRPFSAPQSTLSGFFKLALSKRLLNLY
jgi:hypothetical protein